MTPSIINTESCLVLSPNENGVGLSGQVQQEREDKPESWQALFVCVLRALCTPGFLLHKNRSIRVDTVGETTPYSIGISCMLNGHTKDTKQPLVDRGEKR
jgi:hypothetical protein